MPGRTGGIRELRSSHMSLERGKLGTASAGPRVWTCVSVHDGVCTVPYAPAACRVCAPAQLESERIMLEKKRLELEEEHLCVTLPAPAASSTGAGAPAHPAAPMHATCACEPVRFCARVICEGHKYQRPWGSATLSINSNLNLNPCNTGSKFEREWAREDSNFRV
jgi:hypothetical protein